MAANSTTITAPGTISPKVFWSGVCLLYTSDAADDQSTV